MQQNEKLDACMKKVDSLQLETDELRSKVEELMLVRDILNETTLPEVQINDIFRLGKVKDNKQRHVKIELSNKEDAVAVMKQKHKLSARFPEAGRTCSDLQRAERT
ncbi:hypothetical protein JTB14_017122 [Gonioctena quinquepunctata]|nr:hypothetical protein JTB14_017122 [Gonioctena quinquepunctata]